MYKTAAEQIKLARYAGTARALNTLGFTAQATYDVLLEKGASSDDAELLIKEAFGALKTLGKGLGWFGKKIPALAKWMRGGSRISKNPGFAQNALRNAGTAFTEASRGMKKDPGGTLWRGVQHYGQGLIGGGSGVGGGLGRATLVGGAGYGMFGGGGDGGENYGAPLPPNYTIMQGGPSYNGQ